MAIKSTLEALVYFLAIAVSLAALGLMAVSTSQFDITKVVYQAF
jgi:hypothetical protein